MDSLDGGVFLSQLIYWSDHSKRSDGFFYKTYEEWHEEIHVSEHRIKKHVKKLNELEVVVTKRIKANGSPTIHYKLNIERLNACLLSFLKNLRMENENIQNGNLKNSDSILKNFSIENESFDIGNGKFSERKIKNLSNDSENIQNGNLKNSDSLTKITTKTTQENTTEITTKDFNNDFITKKTTETTDNDSLPASSISNSVNNGTGEEEEKRVVGPSVSSNDGSIKKQIEKQSSLSSVPSLPFSKQLERVKESYKFAFGDVNSEEYSGLKTILQMYRDENLICEAISEISQQDEIPAKPYNEIPGVMRAWKNKGINSYEQLIAKRTKEQAV
ncbi:DnaD domain protein [Ureibacillus sp. Re31]|uniref:DnaD domain protein n=1 Tax=Ureibacillus galli TaxID=2762222 RepID=A0ABR8X8D8_9BACL|nr:DnaD domain protein [Ureibacillus galli]MBD8025560.1 DnaD domain protein [Ureibacillus galli]